MERFTTAVESALASKNWYGALLISLTLPDVCGRLENPKDGVGERYVRWFEKFVQPRYMWGDIDGGDVFLSGADCYALRCSFLHQGSGDITEQRARDALDSFHFISPPGDGSSFHMIENNAVLPLQTDIFCQDILDGVRAWEKTIFGNADVSQQKMALLEIHDASGDFSF